MANNTSATGGYLLGTAPPLSREGIEDLWHDVVVGICAISPTLVRPAYQETPPAIPGHSTVWAAVYCRPGAAVNFPEVRHLPEGEGQDMVVDHVRWDVTVMFYGPTAEDMAGALRRGLQVEQNRLVLRRSGVSLVAVGAPVTVPELDDRVWRRRADLSIETVVRTTSRYDVLNLLRSAGPVGDGDFDTERV